MNSNEELAQMLDEVFQRAVNGELRGAVVVSVDTAGKLQVVHVNLPNTEALGMLQLGANMLISEALRGVQR